MTPTGVRFDVEAERRKLGALTAGELRRRYQEIGGDEARGDAGSDSDIDLAVIVRDDAPERQSTPRMAAEALWGLERGADVVVFRESEFAARRTGAVLAAYLMKYGSH